MSFEALDEGKRKTADEDIRTLLTHVVLKGEIVDPLWILLVVVLLGSNPAADQVIADGVGQRLFALGGTTIRK